MAELGIFEAIHTLRAIRRYKPDPVPQADIRRVLDAAIRGPSAVNRQPYRFLVVTDADARRGIADYYHRAWQMGQENKAAQRLLANDDQNILSHAAEFGETGIYQVPVFILACATSPNAGDSILQCVQNLMLAARGLGLGTIFTTLLRRFEKEIKADLNIPDDVEIVCTIPMGYPATTFGPVRRKPVEEVTYYNTWGERSVNG